jgi:ABC-type long-subunit fatty acid transport system fused permease/ATPase subunit
VKRVVYLVVVALVAMMILVPTAMAQDTVIQKEQKVTTVIEAVRRSVRS